MRRKCRERFHCPRLQRKRLVSGPNMHHGTCVTHVLWCMSGTLTRSGGKNVPGIPGASATCNLTYLARGPWINGRNNQLDALLEEEIYFAWCRFCSANPNVYLHSVYESGVGNSKEHQEITSILNGPNSVVAMWGLMLWHDLISADITQGTLCWNRC